MNEQNRPAYYAIIPSEVRYCEKLKFAERLLYGEITALAGKEGYCFASNKYFSELYHVIPGTISRWISHLEALGFIKVEIIKSERNQVIERRIYINDNNRDFMPNTYKQNEQYPYEQKNTYPISRKAIDNNININIDRFFNYFIYKKDEILEEMSLDEYLMFWEILERLEFNYTKEIIEVFTKDNIEKIKIIIYTLKELFKNNKKLLLQKVTREKLLLIYDNCKRIQIQYENTEKYINNFFDYYYASIIKEVEKG